MQRKKILVHSWQIDCNANQVKKLRAAMCKSKKISPGGESNARSQDFVVINYSLAP